MHAYIHILYTCTHECIVLHEIMKLFQHLKSMMPSLSCTVGFFLSTPPCKHGLRNYLKNKILMMAAIMTTMLVTMATMIRVTTMPTCNVMKFLSIMFKKCAGSSPIATRAFLFKSVEINFKHCHKVLSVISITKSSLRQLLSRFIDKPA